MSAHRVAERDDEHEGAVAFEVTRPLALTQLDKELAEAEGWDTPSGLVGEGIITQASEEHPVTIWVLNPDVNVATFKKVVTNHAGPKKETT